MQSKGISKRAILQIHGGPMAFKKTILEPGQVLQVGRSEAMDLCLPHDSRMSSAHFELTWNGRSCWIRDLKSTGTFLGGRPIKVSLATHGEWIRAGTTDFSVYIEGHVPLQLSAAQAQILAVLAEQEQLFAVLDAARSPRALELLQGSTEDYRSLYEGPQGEALGDVAPYLVKLSPHSRLLEHLLAEGWGQAWGIYFTCPLPLVETRRHLRKFLMVEAEGEDGRLYFRFYDPRVLHTFLPTCTPEQKKAFLGPITRFFHEAGDELVSSS